MNFERVVFYMYQETATLFPFLIIKHANFENAVLDFVLSLEVPSMSKVGNTLNRTLYYITKKIITFLLLLVQNDLQSLKSAGERTISQCGKVLLMYAFVILYCNVDKEKCKVLFLQTRNIYEIKRCMEIITQVLQLESHLEMLVFQELNSFCSSHSLSQTPAHQNHL